MRRDDSSDEDIPSYRRDIGPPEVQDIVNLEYELKPVLTPQERGEAYRRSIEMLNKINKEIGEIERREWANKTPMDKVVDPFGAEMFLMADDQKRWEEMKRRLKMKKSFLTPRAQESGFWGTSLESRRLQTMEAFARDARREQEEIARRKAAEQQQHTQNQTPFPWA